MKTTESKVIQSLLGYICSLLIYIFVVNSGVHEAYAHVHDLVIIIVPIKCGINSKIDSATIIVNVTVYKHSNTYGSMSHCSFKVAKPTFSTL